MKDQEITVPVPLDQLEAVHQIWMEFSSIVTITDQNPTEVHGLMVLLEPLSGRLGNIVVEEWETLIDKAESAGSGVTEKDLQQKERKDTLVIRKGHFSRLQELELQLVSLRSLMQPVTAEYFSSSPGCIRLRRDTS